MPHILPTSYLVRRLNIPILSFTMPSPGLLSQQKRHEILYGTQTGKDDLSFTSMIDDDVAVCGWKQIYVFL